MALLFKNLSSREPEKNQYTYGIIEGDEAFPETKCISLLPEEWDTLFPRDQNWRL